MARYLMYTSPARGHLYPVVDTLLELVARGHDVHVRTLASEVPALQALGLHAEPIAPAIEKLPLDDWSAATQEEALAGGLRTFAARTAHEVPDLQRAIAELGPDALVVDITTLGAAALAESTSLPWAQTMPFFQHIFPFTVNQMGFDTLNGPRETLGLLPLTSPSEVWRAPLNVYFTAPPFLPPGLDVPESFRLVGPGLWEPATTAPTWLEELEEPIVLVAISSEFQLDDALIETSLEALASEDVRVVITTAAHDPDRFTLPRNAHVARWLPHGPIVRKAACVVCHGGMGITQKALAAGTPVCVVPFGRDQFEVAGQVVRSGAGTQIHPSALDPSSLREGVQKAMSLRTGAERIAEGFIRAGGAPAAATALETLLATTPVAR